jgi:hypothetical protein
MYANDRWFLVLDINSLHQGGINTGLNMANKPNTSIGISFEVDPYNEDQFPMPHIISNEEQLTKSERTKLNADEKELLERYVKQINDELLALGTIGASLYQIKVLRLYRESHSSFEKFCEDTFNLSRSHAYRLASEYEVTENFKDASPKDTATPNGTGQARVVSGLPKEDQLKVGKRVKHIAGDRSTTAQDWEQAKQELADEGELPAQAKPKKSTATKAAKDTPPEPGKVTLLTIDPTLVPLKTLKQKADRYDKLTGTNRTIVEKSRLWQEIKSGLHAWAAWEEQQLNQKGAA